MLKILLVGPSMSGKTTLICRHINNNENEAIGIPTLGLNIYNLNIRRNVIKNICVWDLAGSYFDKAIISSCYSFTKGIVLMYHYCNPRSILEWINDMQFELNYVPLVICATHVHKSIDIKLPRFSWKGPVKYMKIDTRQIELNRSPLISLIEMLE